MTSQKCVHRCQNIFIIMQPPKTGPVVQFKDGEAVFLNVLRQQEELC